MGFDDYSVVILFGFLGLFYIFYGLTERYCSSDIRKEESYKVSDLWIFTGSFLLLFDLSLFLIESGYEIYGFLPFLFPIIIGAYVITIAIKFSKTDDLRKIKELKLADEIYLDRVDSLKPSHLFLNRYKFTARLIDIYGEKKTARIYFLTGVFLLLLWLGVFSFFSSLGLCFFSILFILLFAFYYYNYRKTVETFENAVRLAESWKKDQSASST